MNPRMLLGGVSLLFSASVSAQTDVAILESFVCDSSGAPKAVRLGEPFWVGTRFRVVGTPNASFKYRVETAYAKVESPRLSFGTAAGEYFVYWGPIPTLMDGLVEVRTMLDPEKRVKESNRANNSAAFSIVPTAPQSPIELYNPRSLTAKLGFDLQFKRGSGLPTSLTTWMPLPAAETFQRPLGKSADQAFLELTADPFDQPLLIKTEAPQTVAPRREELHLFGEASSVRTSMAHLRQFSGLPDPEMRMWLQAERLIELGRPEFAKWVGTVTTRERPAPPTVDVALAIYQSVLRECVYDGRPGVAPSAYNVLKKKKGDCGALSSLFVALCRTAGIPARTVAGFGAGRSNWHIWAEFHVNGAGWVPVDPAYAEGLLHKGSDLPIYFGVVPELNERVATAYGLDRWVGGQSIQMLQSPAIFWQGRNVKIQKFTPFSELVAN